jgi:hypothetical protein
METHKNRVKGVAHLLVIWRRRGDRMIMTFARGGRLMRCIFPFSWSSSVLSPHLGPSRFQIPMNPFVTWSMSDLLKSPAGVEFGQCCRNLGDSIRNRVGFRIQNNCLSKRDERTFLGKANDISNCRRSHRQWFDQGETFWWAGV